MEPSGVTSTNSFQSAWQNLSLHIDPVFLQLGPISLRYYGLMFVAAIIISYYLLRYRIKQKEATYSAAMLEDFFTWVVIGVILGARVGYVLIYNLPYYLSHPLEIFLPFTIQGGFRFIGISGLSYHGGVLGGILGAYFFAKRTDVHFLRLLDFLIPVVPFGYTFGRIGNFLNGELFGRASDVPWAMYFYEGGRVLRHPSQLYEALFEGIILFAVLWRIRNRKTVAGFHLGAYLVGYGVVRFFIEFTREADAQLGYFWNKFTMGQLLCFIMILGGFLLISGKLFNKKTA